MPDARPYRVAADDAVRPGAWSMTTPDGERLLPDWLATWDIGKDLQVTRRVVLDGEALQRSTGLVPATSLALTVVLATPSFTMSLARVPVALGDEVIDVLTAAEISGRSAAGIAGLRTTLVLDERPASAAPRTAPRRGSVLWQDEHKLRLHGDASQFPITVVDFGGDTGFDPAAPWLLELGEDLHRPAMGTIRLFVNRRFDRVVAALTDTVDDPPFALLRSMVYADVGRTMLERAVSVEDLDADWPDESLGAVLRDLLGRLPMTREALQKEREVDPAAWAARCHALFRSTEGLR